MNRYIVVGLLAALTLAAPAPSSAQTRSERDREREQERIEREREKKQEAAEQARDREQERREREQERRDREQEKRDRDRERRSAGALDTTVAFEARGTVSVSCPGGEVIVVGSERNEIKVRARTQNGAIRFTSSGARATIEPASGRGCSDGRFEITVPVGARVSATSWSGTVSVRGVHGDVDTHTQSGDTEIDDVGRLDLETLSGDVRIRGVKGDVSINTASGEVELTGVNGSVEIETVSGEMTLRDIVAKQVRIHSTSGDLDFNGQILDAGRYEFNTHSGEIRLDLPADVGAQLSVSTYSGAIESDFPITLKAGDHGSAKKLNFTLGQGTARIDAETFSGDITLRSAGRRR